MLVELLYIYILSVELLYIYIVIILRNLAAMLCFMELQLDDVMSLVVLRVNWQTGPKCLPSPFLHSIYYTIPDSIVSNGESKSLC